MTKARDLADLLDASGNLKEKQGRTVGGRDLKNDGDKLDGVEAGATADQTHSEIRALIVAGVDTNVFTDADHSKLDGIEAGATADQTAAEIKTAYESNANTNEFSDAEQSKLAGIETGATADQTKADIDALNVDADTLDGQHGSYYTSYADTAVANIVDSAPGTLDTLNELAAALGDDPNFATTTATNIGTKANKTITVSAGSGLTGGGDLTANRTISHADTSSQPSLTALTGAAVVSDIDVDTYGHVTGLATRNITLANLGYTGETNATADQTASEIRSLVEAATDSNVFTDADHNKLNAIEANAKDDQTITAGSGLTGGGTGNVTLNHADTSNVSNANNSGNTFIQDINFDGFGHVTSVGTGTVSVGNGTLTVQGTGALGGSGTFTANQSGNATISISHDDTSSQGSVNNSGATVIQDVTLDGYGHITGLASKTLTLADLGGSASANSIQGYSSAPAVPAEGGIYYNTTEDVLYISNGVSWKLLLDAPPTFTGGAFSQTSVSGASFSNNPRSYFSDDVTSNAQLVLTRSGSLPPGITETGDVISGTLPVVATTTSYSFSYVATDGIGNTSPPKTYSINVTPPPPALTTATGGSTFTHSGKTFYKHSGFSEFSFSVQPGGILYVAMIGATGGQVSGTRGGAGLGFAKIIIPTGVTTLYGSCGERGTGGAAGRRGGGTAGSGGGGYSPYQSGGAGYTGLFTSSSRSHSSILAMVGGGGSGGHAGGGGGTTYPKGGGGGFNLNGGNHQADGTDVAYGGTLTAGGVSVFGNRGYTSNNAGSGSALQGGRGSDGQYDAGGGGGAGYYGGAGGQGGGGVDGRGGGGGSGYLDLAHGSVLYALTGNHNTRANDLAIGISGSSAFDGNAIISQAVNLDYGGGDQYNSSENGEQGVMLLWS